MRITLEAINEELARRGSDARVEKGPHYFYFSGGETADWLDRTVNAQTLSSLSIEQWAAEFERLKNLNNNILQRSAGKRSPGLKNSSAKRWRRGNR